MASTPAIDNFVTRNGGRELWLLGRGLQRLDLTRDVLEEIDLGWRPDQINFLPWRDLFVLTRPRENSVSFWSPASRTTTRTVALPIASRR